MHEPDKSGRNAGAFASGSEVNAASATGLPAQPGEDASSGGVMADPDVQRKICRLCIHYRMRPNMVLFAASELGSPGVLKAQNEYDQKRTQQAHEEGQRALTRQPFDYEPHHLPWCAYFTRNPENELFRKARAGDSQAFVQLMRDGGISVNSVTGDITPHYILCVWMNENENCEHFESSDHA